MAVHTPEKSRSGHGYSSLYTALMEPLRHGRLNLLVLGGNLTDQILPAWKEYFCHSYVRGIDATISTGAQGLNPLKVSATHYRLTRPRAL